MQRRGAKFSSTQSKTSQFCVFVINTVARGADATLMEPTTRTDASHAQRRTSLRATAIHPRPPRTDIKGIRTGDDCRNPIRNNRTSRPCTPSDEERTDGRSIDGPIGLGVTFDTGPIKLVRRGRNERKWAPGTDILLLPCQSPV